MLRKLTSRCLTAAAPNTCTQHRLVTASVRYLAKVQVGSTWSSVSHTLRQQSAAYSTHEGRELSPPKHDPAEPDILYSKVNVEVMGHDPTVLNSYEFFATEAAKLLDIPVESETPPKIIDKRTLLKSRHVHGKYHKVQYEARTHFKLIKLSRLTGSTADTYLEYIQRNLPEGMAMKVSKTKIEAFPGHIKGPETGEKDMDSSKST